MNSCILWNFLDDRLSSKMMEMDNNRELSRRECICHIISTFHLNVVFLFFKKNVKLTDPMNNNNNINDFHELIEIVFKERMMMMIADDHNDNTK